MVWYRIEDPNDLNNKVVINDNDAEITETNNIKTISSTNNKVSYYKEYEVYNGDKDSIDYNLEAYDKDGNLVWKLDFNDLPIADLDLVSDITVDSNVIYLGVSGSLYAIDGIEGEILWFTTTYIGIISKPYVEKDKIYVTAYYGPVLTCFDKNGDRLWQYEDDDMFLCTDVTKIDNKIVIEYGDLGHTKMAFFNVDGTLDKVSSGTLPRNNIKWDKVTASSVLESDNQKYGPNNINDNDTTTAWVEGANKYGKNEWINLERNSIAYVKEIEILNGYHKSLDTFDNNGRLKKFRLDFSNNKYLVFEVKEDDGTSIFTRSKIFLSEPLDTKSLKLTILDAYSGLRYEDTCISEIITK